MLSLSQNIQISLGNKTALLQSWVDSQLQPSKKKSIWLVFCLDDWCIVNKIYGSSGHKTQIWESSTKGTGGLRGLDKSQVNNTYRSFLYSMPCITVLHHNWNTCLAVGRASISFRGVDIYWLLLKLLIQWWWLYSAEQSSCVSHCNLTWQHSANYLFCLGGDWIQKWFKHAQQQSCGRVVISFIPFW